MNTRIIQAWNHAGSWHLIHAIHDSPEERARVRLGRLGVWATPLCVPDRHSRFMRLSGDKADAPTYTPDGWLEDANPAGRDWTQEPEYPAQHKCVACERALRKKTATQ